MKLAASIIFAIFSYVSAFKLTNGPSSGPELSRDVRNPLDMPYTRRTACPMIPVRRGQPIPGFEDRHWNLPEIYRKRLNKKIANFEKNRKGCDTMLVRIEKNQVIDICFHYEWEIGNPWSMETTCVSEKFKEIECYMGTSPFAISQMPESCQDKENMPIFLSPSLMKTGLGALLYDFDPISFDSESQSESYGQSWSGNYESFGPSESFGQEWRGSYESSFYESIPEYIQSIDETSLNNSLDDILGTQEQYYYIDSNGNLKISDCDPSSPNCNVDDDRMSSELRRRKRGLASKVPVIRSKNHQKRKNHHR